MDKCRPEVFRWHSQTSVLTPSTTGNARSSVVRILNGTHCIADVDTESTLSAVRCAIENQQEFCVHPPSFQTTTLTESIKPASGAYFQSLTAGSNGEPKRIRRSHASWLTSFEINAKSIELNRCDSYAIIGNISHSIGLYAALEAAYLGADIHVLTHARPDRQLQFINELGSSILYTTPTQLRQLCANAANANSVRHIYCGGGKLDLQTKQLAETVFTNARLQEFYGASETSFISISDEHTPIRSVGKPYPGVELRFDNDEIWVRSPYLFEHYIDADKQAASWREGFISVGEVGHMDDDGFLYLAGRQSRRVNIAEQLVFPEAIEHCIHAHNAVRACVVVAKADSKRGHVLMAMVEAEPSDRLNKELMALLRKKFGNLIAPKEVLIVPSLPTLPSGKPDLMQIEKQLSAS